MQSPRLLSKLFPQSELQIWILLVFGIICGNWVCAVQPIRLQLFDIPDWQFNKVIAAF